MINSSGDCNDKPIVCEIDVDPSHDDIPWADGRTSILKAFLIWQATKEAIPE